MNPSAADWILKFLSFFDEDQLNKSEIDEKKFYQLLRETGFIYGNSLRLIDSSIETSISLTEEEITKVNLFHSLVFYFYKENPDKDQADLIESLLEFYSVLGKDKTGFFSRFSFSRSPVNQLENIFSARLQEANSLLKNHHITLLTYAFLFVDVLTYKRWLKNPGAIQQVYKQLEDLVLNYCFFTLKSKRKKSKYDRLVIDLYETSSGLVMDETIDGSAKFLSELKALKKLNKTEKIYLLDLCVLTIWEDFKMDRREKQYIRQLLTILNLTQKDLENSMEQMKLFSEENFRTIRLFVYSSPVQQFYTQSSATVKKLISRNKDRLVQELQESGELVLLLGQSTTRELTAAEKKKVRDQLLDICKSIPSLAIFLLPGGSVLMPLLVKFIPRLLPSAFQDNRIE